MLKFQEALKPVTRGVLDVTCDEGLVIELCGERKLLFRMPGNPTAGLSIGRIGLSYASLEWYAKNATPIRNIDFYTITIEVPYA